MANESLYAQAFVPHITLTVIMPSVSLHWRLRWIRWMIYIT